MGRLEPPGGGGFGDAVAGGRLSTDSVGKAGDVVPQFRCVARVCGVVDRGGDFVGDGRAAEALPRAPAGLGPTGSASLSQGQRPLRRTLQHPCASAPVPNDNGRPGAKRQADRRRHACFAGTQDWHAPGGPGGGDGACAARGAFLGCAGGRGAGMGCSFSLAVRSHRSGVAQSVRSLAPPARQARGFLKQTASLKPCNLFQTFSPIACRAGVSCHRTEPPPTDE